MRNIFSWFKKENSDFEMVAKKELRENREVLESLRQYDQGEKDISTDNVERRLHNIRPAS